MPVPCTLPGFTVFDLLFVLQEVGIFMARFLHQDFARHNATRNIRILICFWIAGSLCGLASACFAGPTVSSLMRKTAFCSVSIVSLLVTVFLPFLLSAFAVIISAPGLIFPIAFTKSFLQIFVSMGIFLTFGSAGWLFRILIGFADFVSVPLLVWFWLRCLGVRRSAFYTDFLFAVAFLFLITCIDYRIISPLLADFINL